MHPEILLLVREAWLKVESYLIIHVIWNVYFDKTHKTHASTRCSSGQFWNTLRILADCTFRAFLNANATARTVSQLLSPAVLL